LSFDHWISALVDTDLAEGIRLVDCCRYVDDMRLIITAGKGKTSMDVKSVVHVRIPVQRDHSFQANAATHSVLKQPLIPVNAATLW
jgi:hypothetical protein